MSPPCCSPGIEPEPRWKDHTHDWTAPYLVERDPGYLEYQLPISVKLVVDYHGRVPLLRNERDEWELPGGKLEVGTRVSSDAF